MKKTLIILTIITLLVLSGCSHSSAPVNDSEKYTYKALEIYLMDISSNSDSLSISKSQPVITTRITEEEINITSSSFSVGDYQTTGEYINTKTQIGKRAVPTRYYTTEYGSIGTDKTSGNIVSINFQVSELIDKDKNTDVLTENQCERIALEFLNMASPDTDLKDYSLSKTGLKTVGEGQPYCHKFYGYHFQKYINGIPTTDSFSICVTEYGSIIFYNRGDSVDEQKINSMNMEYTRVESIVTEYATDICESMTGENIAFSLTTPTYVVLDNGVYALTYGILIDCTINGTPVSAGVEVVVPLENG